MADEETLEINPDSLTGKECLEFSSNPQLRRKYEEKWGNGITDICDRER